MRLPDHLTAETEVGEFLYGFIRLAKPKTVIETGCHWGHTSEYIGKALKENGYGILYTCDTSDTARQETATRCKGLPVEVHNCTGVQLIRDSSAIDIAFLDSGANLQRAAEAQALIGHLSPLAWVFLHDSLQTDDPCYPEIIARTNWWNFNLPYGRGLAMFAIGQGKVKP